jgi:hypothetical protein
VEQQLAAWLAERQVAQFINGDEIIAQQFLGEAAGAASGFLLLKLIDEIAQVEKAPLRPGTNDRRRDADAQVSFAGAGSADKDHIAPCVQEGAGGEFAHQSCIDRRVGEDEFANILEEPGTWRRSCDS